MTNNGTTAKIMAVVMGSILAMIICKLLHMNMIRYISSYAGITPLEYLPENMKINLPDDVELMTTYDMIHHILDFGCDDGFNERIQFVCPSRDFDENAPLSSEFYLAMRDEDKIVACLTLFSFSKNTISICGISTDPEYQNQGMAKHLLQSLETICTDNKLKLSTSDYTLDGQKYIQHIVDGIKTRLDKTKTHELCM